MLAEKNPDGRMKKDPRRARLTLIEERVLRMRYGRGRAPCRPCLGRPTIRAAREALRDGAPARGAPVDQAPRLIQSSVLSDAGATTAPRMPRHQDRTRKDAPPPEVRHRSGPRASRAPVWPPQAGRAVATR